MPTAAPPKLDFKAFDALTASVVEDEPGTVVALVAVTGNTDDGGDIIAPGAFHFKRTPKVVWSHDLKTLVGKVLSHEELAPGDPRLPADLVAKGLGALQFKIAFDLEDPESFKAYRKVVFHEDLGWSIGYETPPDGFKTLPDGRRLLTKIFVWEGSPTTFGMNMEARTMSAKSLIRSTLDRLDLDETKAKTLETLFESLAGEDAAETKALPALTGSFEETQEAVRNAVRAWAVEVYGEVGPENDWWVSVDGTFEDSVVATIRVYSGDNQTATWQFGYVLDDDGGVLLGEAQEVDIRATVTPAGTTSTAAAADPVTDAAGLDEVKALLDDLDVKKGAVLSAANAAKLQAAHEAIAKVLAAAAKEEKDDEGEKAAVVAREVVPKGEGGTIEVKATPAAQVAQAVKEGEDEEDPEEDEVVPVSDADLVEMMALADS